MAIVQSVPEQKQARCLKFPLQTLSLRFAKLWDEMKPCSMDHHDYPKGKSLIVPIRQLCSCHQPTGIRSPTGDASETRPGSMTVSTRGFLVPRNESMLPFGDFLPIFFSSGPACLQRLTRLKWSWIRLPSETMSVGSDELPFERTGGTET